MGNPPQKTYIILGPEISGDIQFVHPDRRRRPACALERIKGPASSIILARILLPRHLSVDLNHRVQHIPDVLRLRQGGEPDAKVGARVAGQHDARTRAVEVVARVADFADAGDVGRGGAAAEDGQVEVFPETGLELERDLFCGGLMSIRTVTGSYGQESLPCRLSCMVQR